MISKEITWTVDGIEAAFRDGRQTPTLTRGSEITLSLVFEEIVDRTTETTTESTAYGAEDATYSFSYNSVESTTETTTTRTFAETYDELLGYLDYLGDEIVRRGTTDRGVPWFRERLPDAAPVDTLVVPVEMGDDIIDPRDMWAIIVGGEDISRPPSTYRSVDLDLFVLAPLDDYADREAVIDDLGDHL